LRAVSSQTTRVPSPMTSPFRPATYLYATDCSSVFATASCRSRFVPRYTV
jgi:hypothetical protein